MKKRIFFLAALAIGVGLTSFAQVDVRQSVETTQKQLMEKLKKDPTKTKSEWESGQQFVIEKGKIIKYGKNGKNSLSSSSIMADVVKTISKGNGFNIDSLVYHINIVSAVPKTTRTERGRKNNKHYTTDTISYEVVTRMENCKTQLSCTYKQDNENIKNTYIADYIVEMRWNVETKRERVTGRVVGFDKVNLTKVKTVFVNNDEIAANKQKAAEKAIKQWYENEAVAAVTEEVNKDYLVVATPKPTYTKVNVSGVKANSNSLSNVEGNVINVSVDPAKFIKEGEEYLYTNSGASVDVTPKFAIKFDNNNNASVTVSSYSIKENKPVANEIMVSQKNNAFETCDNFKNKLQSFVQNKNDKKLKQEIISMFADKKAKVFTSTVIDDKELPIKERSVEQYLNSLKAESINIKVDADMKGDIKDPVFEFSQDYQGGNYCDNTIKQIQLHWDGEKYVINNVVVEKGKTTPCVK